jgi:nucleotide-binding universal stress UspA family protein
MTHGHRTHRLSNAFQGALAGGGDPATSPLYVFGPFLKLIVLAGVANVTFGASIWLVVFTVVTVSAMYRLVMRWVVDGSGGSGLTEEEFGSWAVKVNAGVTFVEYTLTFLVSVAALVTFVADRVPVLNTSWHGVPLRTLVAVGTAAGVAWLVNRGPRTAARAFGPATFAVLVLLWAMIVAVLWQRGFHLPALDLRAFHPPYLNITLAAFARLLALMTGIEVFANLVAAYSGTDAERSRKAFTSLLIIMGTTCAAMLIVGPAILELSDPLMSHVSVFTQAMDKLLPEPLPWIGTVVGVLVLGSAAAASAQGIQNLALGLRHRHYIPAWLGRRNRFDVADRPVLVEAAIVTLCFACFGTREETYLSIYAVGVFILLSMTSWAATRRLLRELRQRFTAGHAGTLVGAGFASVLTTAATIIVFGERLTSGAWAYLLLIPLLYAVFSGFRGRLGAPRPLDEHLGRFFTGQYLLPFQRYDLPEDAAGLDRIVVLLDDAPIVDRALQITELLARTVQGRVDLVSVRPNGSTARAGGHELESAGMEPAMRLAERLRAQGCPVAIAVREGDVPEQLERFARERRADLIVTTTRNASGLERFLQRDVAIRIVRRTELPVLITRPASAPIEAAPAFRKLLVCLDGSEASEEVLPWARVFARQFGSTVALLSVPEAESEERRLRHYLGSVAEALGRIGLSVETHVTGPGASSTIVHVAASESCDLILMATRGRDARDAMDREVGSITAQVVHSAPCPVLAITAVGFEHGRAGSARSAERPGGHDSGR